MFKKKKEFKTTSKIDYGFTKYQAREKLAKAYVEADKHDRAVKAFNDAEILMMKAWENVYELYPKLRSETLVHHQYEHVVRIKE